MRQGSCAEEKVGGIQGQSGGNGQCVGRRGGSGQTVGCGQKGRGWVLGKGRLSPPPLRVRLLSSTVLLTTLGSHSETSAYTSSMGHDAIDRHTSPYASSSRQLRIMRRQRLRHSVTAAAAASLSCSAARAAAAAGPGAVAPLAAAAAAPAPAGRATIGAPAGLAAAAAQLRFFAPLFFFSFFFFLPRADEDAAAAAVAAAAATAACSAALRRFASLAMLLSLSLSSLNGTYTTPGGALIIAAADGVSAAAGVATAVPLVPAISSAALRAAGRDEMDSLRCTSLLMSSSPSSAAACLWPEAPPCCCWR